MQNQLRRKKVTSLGKQREIYGRVEREKGEERNDEIIL